MKVALTEMWNIIEKSDFKKQISYFSDVKLKVLIKRMNTDVK